MSLFDYPNDMQWQSQVNSFRRGSNETMMGTIVDERNDGNYLDNMFQKYTVELLGWGQKLYNCKVKIDSAGYNGTGNYQSFKAGDGVIIQCKEGQLDEAIIVGSTRLNGDLNQLENNGQALKFGEHHKGSRGTASRSSPPSLHPGRVTKTEGNIFVGGVNNARTTFEDPTQLGVTEDSLDKQPIPGVFKGITKEGVDINYTYGGKLEMTDGNFVVLSSGTTQNKCTKYLEQASRHKKIADHLTSLSEFVSSGIRNVSEFLENLDNDDLELDVKANNDSTISVTPASTIKDITTGKPINSNIKNDNKEEFNNNKSSSNSTKDNKEESNISVEKPKEKNYAKKAGSNLYRSSKHLELAMIAKTQAEECNANNAAYQYSSLLMNNATSNSANNGGSTTSVTPGQGIGHVDANNYSSRNTDNPKPPTEFVGCHSNNFKAGPHTLKYLVMHHSVATMEGTINTFKDSKRLASAHYAVGKDGKVVQFVKDSDIAYHVGGMNTGKIGIEIIATKPNEGMTKEQEESLIKLSRFILSTYKIPIDNVKGHNYFHPGPPPKPSTECPTWIFPTHDKLKEWSTKYLQV